MDYKEKLKEIRLKSNLSQKEIGNYLGISRSTYKDYELQIKIMPVKYICDLVDYFNISIDYLFGFGSNNYANSKSFDINVSSKRLKEFRKENKITQDKLALLLNTTHSMISKYENAKSLIATPFLYEICKKYKISADYLLGKIDSPKYLK